MQAQMEDKELAELTRGAADRLGRSAQYTEAERLDFFSRATVRLLAEVSALKRARFDPE